VLPPAPVVDGRGVANGATSPGRSHEGELEVPNKMRRLLNLLGRPRASSKPRAISSVAGDRPHAAGLYLRKTIHTVCDSNLGGGTRGYIQVVTARSKTS
jgi:hypothetical protein